MYCNNCGTPLSDNAQYCINCGNQIENCSYAEITISEDDSLNYRPAGPAAGQADAAPASPIAPTPAVPYSPVSTGSIPGQMQERVYHFTHSRSLRSSIVSAHETDITISGNRISITERKGRYNASDKPGKTTFYDRSQILSVAGSHKVEPTGFLFAGVWIVAAIILQKWYLFIMAVLFLLPCISSVIKIKLTNGKKIIIRYSTNNPSEEFLQEFRKEV